LAQAPKPGGPSHRAALDRSAELCSRPPGGAAGGGMTVASVPIYIGPVEFEQLCCEGARGEGGEPFFSMKLGVKIPLSALRQALEQLEHDLEKLLKVAVRGPAGMGNPPGLSRPPAAADTPAAALAWCMRGAEDGQPGQELVVKNTFLTVEEKSAQESKGLPRTSTAPPTYQGASRVGPVGTIAEEEDEEGEDSNEEYDEDSEAVNHALPGGVLASLELAQARALGSSFGRTETWDGFSYDGCDPHTWLPAMQHSQGVEIQPPMLTAPPLMPIWTPEMVYGMQQAFPFAPGFPAGTASEPVPGSAFRALSSTYSEPEEPEAPPADIDRPQTLQHTFSVNSGCMRWTWNVSARKLQSGDTHAHISPTFHLSFGESFPHVPFKMMIHPKVASTAKGGASFKKARGRGYIEVVCEESLADDCPEVGLRIIVGSGDARLPTRAIISHRFAERAVASLPRGQAEWDFRAAVDRETGTFTVCLEIEPRPSNAAASDASGICEDSGATGTAPKTKKW